MSTISTDNIGGGDGFGFGGGGYAGIWIFAIIFLFVVFVIFFGFRRGEHHEGGLEKLLPYAAMMNQKHNCHEDGCDNARLWHDLAEEHGKTRHDIDKSTYDLQHSMDLQNCSTQKMIGDVITNQNRLAFETALNTKDEKLAELRLALAEERSKTLHQETVNVIQRNAAETNRRIEHVECRMVKQPSFLPFGGVPAVNPCVPGPAWG